MRISLRDVKTPVVKKTPSQKSKTEKKPCNCNKKVADGAR